MTFRHGLVVGKFYPPHAGHHRLISRAAAMSQTVTVVVAPSSAESIPLELRMGWLREMHPEVQVVGVYDDHPVDYGDRRAWEAHVSIFRDALGDARVDAVFTSERYGDELARRMGATHVCVDRERSGVAVSGTAVRADPVEHWDHLAPPVRAWFTRRVAVVGAESSGTTTVAAGLAAHFRRRGGVWQRTRCVPEFGRELTARKLAALRSRRAGASVGDVVWARRDFVQVARTQNAMEDAAARDGSPLLICDTDARATALWEERYLGSASDAVRSRARRPAFYLLTDHAGVPFEDDGLRDGEHVRARMTRRFREELREAGVPFAELRGPLSSRLERAVDACDELLAAGWDLASPLRPT